jgi:hypothetical protein
MNKVTEEKETKINQQFEKNTINYRIRFHCLYDFSSITAFLIHRIIAMVIVAIKFN